MASPLVRRIRWQRRQLACPRCGGHDRPAGEAARWSWSHVMHVPSLSAVGEATTPLGLAAVEAALEQTETRVRAEVSDRLSGIGLDGPTSLASGDPCSRVDPGPRPRAAPTRFVVGGKSHGVLVGLLGSVAAKARAPPRRSPSSSYATARNAASPVAFAETRRSSEPTGAAGSARGVWREIRVRLRIISGSIADAHISTEELC